MIFKDATYEAFRYEIFELKLQSNKPIIAACELCGKFRVKVLEWLKVNDIRKYKIVLNVLGADT